MKFLDKVIEHKIKEVENRKAVLPLEKLKELIAEKNTKEDHF